MSINLLHFRSEIRPPGVDFAAPTRAVPAAGGLRRSGDRGTGHFRDVVIDRHFPKVSPWKSHRLFRRPDFSQRGHRQRAWRYLSLPFDDTHAARPLATLRHSRKWRSL